MGIFTRVRDIISANINTMLDSAEDPEKLIKMMVREMEDTLVEVKASCAGAMATKKKIQRELEECKARTEDWGAKAQLALDKNREDLAREALIEKRRYSDRVETLESESKQCAELIEHYQGDISQLEDKLTGAREKRRILVQRHVRAQGKMRAEQHIRRFDTAEAMQRFDSFEDRIDRIEADADLVNYGRKPSLDDEFRKLEGDESIEEELAALKAKQK